MPDTFVYLEFDTAGKPVRIFRTDKAAANSVAWDEHRVKLWHYARAVQEIRHAVFERDGWACIHCGNDVTWNTGHMHEKQARGDIREVEEGTYSGGEISLDNSETRCYNCHLVDPTGHGKRKPQFSQ